MHAGDWLWANPALRREWSRTGRPATRLRAVGRWTGLILTLVVYVAGARWLSRPERSPWEARAALLGLCLLYLLCVNVAVPGPAAARISGERDRRTWQALLLTALHPSQVLTAKLLASLWPGGAALGLFFPLFVMSADAARLPISRLLSILALLMGSTVVTASVGLWLSGRCRHTRVALTLAYLFTTLFFWGAVASSPAPIGHWRWLCWYLSPVWEVAVLCLAEPRLLPTTRPLLPEWAWFLLACGMMSGLLIVLLLRRIAGRDER